MDQTQSYVLSATPAVTAAGTLAELGHVGYGERFALDVLIDVARTGRSVTLALADVTAAWQAARPIDPHVWADAYTRARQLGLCREQAERVADQAARS